MVKTVAGGGVGRKHCVWFEILSCITLFDSLVSAACDWRRGPRCGCGGDFRKVFGGRDTGRELFLPLNSWCSVGEASIYFFLCIGGAAVVAAAFGGGVIVAAVVGSPSF